MLHLGACQPFKMLTTYMCDIQFPIVNKNVEIERQALTLTLLS